MKEEEEEKVLAQMLQLYLKEQKRDFWFRMMEKRFVWRRQGQKKEGEERAWRELK